jgi:hypothetical protein
MVLYHKVLIFFLYRAMVDNWTQVANEQERAASVYTEPNFSIFAEEQIRTMLCTCVAVGSQNVKPRH